MSDISLQLCIKEENGILFKRCIRKLLSSTFILRDKDEKLYAFVSRESNRQDISEYLRMIGLDVMVEDKSGVCMLCMSEEDEETVGLQCSGLYHDAVSSAARAVEDLSGESGVQRRQFHHKRRSHR